MMATKDEIVLEISRLADAHRARITAQTLDVWAQELIHVHHSALTAAVSNSIKNDEKMPAIAMLLKQANYFDQTQRQRQNPPLTERPPTREEFRNYIAVGLLMARIQYAVQPHAPDIGLPRLTRERALEIAEGRIKKIEDAGKLKMKFSEADPVDYDPFYFPEDAVG